MPHFGDDFTKFCIQVGKEPAVVAKEAGFTGKNTGVSWTKLATPPRAWNQKKIKLQEAYSEHAEQVPCADDYEEKGALGAHSKTSPAFPADLATIGLEPLSPGRILEEFAQIVTDLQASALETGKGELSDYSQEAEIWALAVYNGEAKRAVAARLLRDAHGMVERWQAEHLVPLQRLRQRTAALRSDINGLGSLPFGRIALQSAMDELDAWSFKLDQALQMKTDELANCVATLGRVEEWGDSGDPDLELAQIVRGRFATNPNYGDLLGEFAEKLMDMDVELDNVWSDLLDKVGLDYPVSFTMELTAVPQTQRFAFLVSFQADTGDPDALNDRSTGPDGELLEVL